MKTISLEELKRMQASRPKRSRPRGGKTDRVPRTRAGGKWTEAGFWGFLRSGLRQMSRRWPPLVELTRSVRRPSQSGNKRQKWEYQCSACCGWFMRKEVEVDHKVPCGSLRSLDDLPGFVERLFCEPDGLRVLCETCHAERTRGVEVTINAASRPEVG